MLKPSTARGPAWLSRLDLNLEVADVVPQGRVKAGALLSMHHSLILSPRSCSSSSPADLGLKRNFQSDSMAQSCPE